MAAHCLRWKHVIWLLCPRTKEGQRRSCVGWGNLLWRPGFCVIFIFYLLPLDTASLSYLSFFFFLIKAWLRPLYHFWNQMFGWKLIFGIFDMWNSLSLIYCLWFFWSVWRGLFANGHVKWGWNIYTICYRKEVNSWAIVTFWEINFPKIPLKLLLLAGNGPPGGQPLTIISQQVLHFHKVCLRPCFCFSLGGH